MTTTTAAIAVAVKKFEIKYGSVWPMPPAIVMRPQTSPRKYGFPRPDNFPSSAKASANPMEIPAPRDAAIPTWKVFHELCVAKTAAKTGANVETEPSISPTSPGCTICNTKLRLAFSSSLPLASCGSRLVSMSPAVRSCCNSAVARFPNNLRIEVSVVREAAS